MIRVWSYETLGGHRVEGQIFLNCENRRDVKEVRNYRLKKETWQLTVTHALEQNPGPEK